MTDYLTEDKETHAIECDNSAGIATTTYSVVRSFIYKGSHNTQKMYELKAIYRLGTDGTGTGKIRLYDATHAAVIAEATGLSATINTIVDLGTISNLPTGESVLEIQLAVTDNSKTIFCDNITIQGGI